MNTLALRLCAFSAAAGLCEILLPEGKIKRSLLALAGLMAVGILADYLMQLLPAA